MYRKIDINEIDWLGKYGNERLRTAYTTLCIGGYNEVPYTDWVSKTGRKKAHNVEFLEKSNVKRITQVCAFSKIGFAPLTTKHTREEFVAYTNEVVKMIERAKNDPHLPALSELFVFSFIVWLRIYTKKIYGICFFCICV